MLLRLHELREAKVGDLDVGVERIVHEQDVLGLEVAVRHPLRVHEVQSGRQLPAAPHGALLSVLALLHDLGEQIAAAAPACMQHEPMSNWAQTALREQP